MTAWQPYKPTTKSPWNIGRVVHLHRRAGFAATWSEIQRGLSEGVEASTRRMIQGNSRKDGVSKEFENIAAVLRDAAIESNNPDRLKAWWIFRLLFSPDPLTEKLALLWHNHFATSNLKIDDLSAMLRQNEIFRCQARAKFGTLLDAVVHDPAMLVWLDAPSNRKGRPNENLSREIMELFTIGIGNYTEGDIKEGARALTGWSVKNDAFQEDEALHDDGDKTILHRKGKWRGDQFVRILLDHPATSERLAWRLCKMFFGDGVLDRAALKGLAQGLRERDLDIGWCVETILRSDVFYSEPNMASRISSPSEFTIGAVRALECFDPPSSTLHLAEWTGRMGQDLFYPPNVGGWTGSRDWLSGSFIVSRAKFSDALVRGQLNTQRKPLSPASLAAKHGCLDLASAFSLVEKLLLGSPLPNSSRKSIVAKATAHSAILDEQLRVVVLLLLSSAQAHVC